MANSGSRINKQFWDNIVVPDLESIRTKAAAGQPTRRDLANKIMADWGMKDLGYDPYEKGKASSKGKGKSPSAISRVFDILSRGLYATAGSLKQTVENAKEGKSPTNILAGPALNSSFWKGLAGKEKTTTRDVLEEIGVKNKLALGVGGFVGDVALDPLTYVPGANIAGAIGKARKGAKAFEIFEDLAPKTVATGRAAKKVQKAISGTRKALPEGASTREAKMGTGPFAPEYKPGVNKIESGSELDKTVKAEHANATAEIARQLAETPTATPESAIAEAAARPAPPDHIIVPPDTSARVTAPRIDIKATYPRYDKFKYTPHFEQREGGGTFFTESGKRLIKTLMSTKGFDQAQAKKFIADIEFKENAPKLHKTAVRRWRKTISDAYPGITTKQLDEVESRLKANPDADIEDLLPSKPHVPDIEGASPAVNAAVRQADEAIADAGRQEPEVLKEALERGDSAANAAVENAMTPNTKATRRPMRKQDVPVIRGMVERWAQFVDDADRVRGKKVAKREGNPYYNISKQRAVVRELWDKTAYNAKQPARRKKRILTLLRHVNAEMATKISSHTGQPMIPTDPYGNPFDLANVIDELDISKYKSLGDIAEHVDNYFSESPKIRATVPDDIVDAIKSMHTPGMVGNAMQKAASAEKFTTPAIREIAQKEAEGISEPALAEFSQKAAKATEEAVTDETGDAATGKLAHDTVYTEPKITEDIGDSYKAQGETPSKVRDYETTLAGRDSVKTERSIAATLGDWFKPSKGMEAVHSILLQGRGFRELNARLNARFLRSMARQYTKTQIKQGYDAFMKNLRPADPRVAEVYDALGTVFSNMVGKSGLSDEILKHHTQLGRSDMVMDEVNKHLRRKGSKFQFSDKVELADGTILNLTENNPRGWMNSIAHFSTDDPLLHLSQMRSAIESAMTERTMMMDFAKKFGSTVRKEGYTKVVDNVHLSDVYVPQELLPQVRKMLDTLNTFNDPKNELLKTFDYTMRIWKTMVTVLNPRHHVNNMIGDTYLNWIAGVSNPVYYMRAAKMMMNEKGVYKNITNIDRMIGEGATGIAKTDPQFSKRTMATLKNGIKFNSEQVMALARKAGILPSAQMTEDINASIPNFLQGIVREYNPSKASFMAGVRGASEMRDHYPRIAQFLHELEHTKGASTHEIVEKAAERVRKYHPDGTNLTQAEQKVLRRLIPFYSWIRKALPVTVEAAVQNPARAVTMPAKALLAIQTATGIEGTELGDPFPEDQLFPSWITHAGIGPIFKPGTKIPMIPESEGYMMINPKLPLFDFMDQWVKSNPAKPLIGQLTPVAKIATEIAMDKNSFTGATISDDKKQYALSNTPLLGSVAKYSGSSGEGVQSNFTKWLLGNMAPVDTGKYEKSAQYEARNNK